MAKRRVNLYLDEEPIEQLTTALEDVPGMSVSSVVNDLVGQAAPFFLEVVEKAKTGDRDALVQLMQLRFSDFVQNGAGHLSKMQERAHNSQKGDSDT